MYEYRVRRSYDAPRLAHHRSTSDLDASGNKTRVIPITIIRGSEVPFDIQEPRPSSRQSRRDYQNSRSRAESMPPRRPSPERESHYDDITSSIKQGKREFPIHRTYGTPGYTTIPIERRYKQEGDSSRQYPVHRVRAKSSENINNEGDVESIYSEPRGRSRVPTDREGVSAPTHRFYDKEGRSVSRERRFERTLEITRSYERLNGGTFSDDGDDEQVVCFCCSDS